MKNMNETTNIATIIKDQNTIHIKRIPDFESTLEIKDGKQKRRERRKNR